MNDDQTYQSQTITAKANAAMSVSVPDWMNNTHSPTRNRKSDAEDALMNYRLNSDKSSPERRL